MKVKKEANEKGFQPFNLILSIESEKEAQALADIVRFPQTISHIIEDYPTLSIKSNEKDIYKFIVSLQKALDLIDYKDSF